ncbi:hypothetical protein [Streptomyces rishiriensis]|uniref:hypothetical protein n=1 Tax=Streptomyces rishiriensis TaxID=68264 RepID=UPI0037D383EE
MPPAPLPATPSPEPKKTWEIVTAVVAIAALGGSVYSIIETRNVEEASKRAAEKEQARKVDVYAAANNEEGVRLFVANRSDSAISDVKVEFYQGYWVKSQVIPGCSVLEIPVKIVAANGGLIISLGHPVRVHFVDVEGRSWVTSLEENHYPDLKRESGKISLKEKRNVDKLIDSYITEGPIPNGCG